VTCKRCRQTASSKCELGLCGHCCDPPCKPDVHHFRQTARGSEGATRRKRTRDIWWHASQLADGYFNSTMHSVNTERLHLSFQKARHLVMRSLIELLRDPDRDIDSDSVHPLLLSTIPVLDLADVVETLRAAFPLQELEEPASASSSAAAAAEPVTTLALVPSMATWNASTFTCAEEDTWWHFSRTPSEVAEHPLELRPRSFQHKRPVDKNDVECAHFCRAHPQKMQVIECRIERPIGVDDFAVVADSVLRGWFAQRPELVDVLQPPRVPVPYVWHKDMYDDGLLDVHNVGRWYFFQLKEWQPPPPEGTDRSTGVYGPHQFTDTIHSASMYTLGSSLLKGLLPGAKPGRGNRTGLFAFDTRTLKRAISSSGYCTYSDLAWNGIFFGPRFVVCIQHWRVGADIGSISVGGGQWCLQPGMYHLKAVYIHAVTAEMVRARGPHQQLWFSADRWLPDYEHEMQLSSSNAFASES
jgi:hypothetical protein